MITTIDRRALELPAVRVGLGAMLLLVGALLPAPLRAPLTLPLILLLPGYATLLAVRLPRSQRDVLPAPLLWLIMSMAVIPVTLLGLHALGLPLRGAWILIAIAGYCVLAALIAPRVAPRSQRPSRATLRGAGLFAGALAAGAAIIAIGLHTLPGSPPDQFSMLALSGKWATVHAPVQVSPDTTTDVAVSITNTTSSSHSYQLRPRVVGEQWAARTVTLSPGQTWHGSVSGMLPAGGCLHRLMIRLDQDGRRSSIDGLTVWFATANPLPGECTLKPVGE